MLSGLIYLSKNNLIHRDLALRNILATRDAGNLNVKISDLGLSTSAYYYKSEVESKSLIPIRWAAPEVIFMRKFSVKSDVWSLGITFWEVSSIH